MKVIGDSKEQEVIVLLTKPEYTTLVSLADATVAFSASVPQFSERAIVWGEAFVWLKAIVRLAWGEYPIKLAGLNRTRFEETIREYAQYLQETEPKLPVELDPPGVINLEYIKSVNLEPSDAQKLVAIDDYIRIKIVEPIEEAREQLQNTSQRLEVCRTSTDYEYQKRVQSAAWHKLQEQLIYRKVADDILNITHGRED